MIDSVRAEWIMVVCELADMTCQYKNLANICDRLTAMCVWNYLSVFYKSDSNKPLTSCIDIKRTTHDFPQGLFYM